jgi:ketosteroid isomerase-like protein
MVGNIPGEAARLHRSTSSVAEQFDGLNAVEATRFIAEGILVAVEGRNLSVTRLGPPCPNRYCWIFEMQDEKAVCITEYCDTALVDLVLVRTRK